MPTRPKIIKYVKNRDVLKLQSHISLFASRALINESCEFQITALMWASRMGDVEAVRVLLEAGADVNLKDREGRTALMFASREGHKDVVEMLIHWWATIDDRDDEGRTALMLACSKNQLSVIAVLLRRGAQPDVTNDRGRTALMYACRDGFSDAVTLLVNNGADVNFCDIEGRTGLVFAAYGNHMATVKTLGYNGANVLLRDRDGWLPRDWAHDYLHEEVANELQKMMLQLQPPSITNSDNPMNSLFARGRGCRVLTELISDKSHPSLKYVFKSGLVPNPWFTWRVAPDEKEAEIPEDFVYPPLQRRHYKF